MLSAANGVSYLVSSSSIAVGLAGAAAGDLVLVISAARWNYTTLPTGWTTVNNNSGSFFNGVALSKVVTSADVTAGSVTLSLGGSSLVGAMAIRVTGAGASPTINLKWSDRWGGGGSGLPGTRTSAGFSAAAGSLMIYAGFVDIPSGTQSLSISRGTQIGSIDQTTNFEQHANSEVLASALPSGSTVNFVSTATNTSAYYIVLEIPSAGTVVAVSQAVEADAALALFALAPRVVTLGVATEADSAQGLTGVVPIPGAIAIGQAAEVDEAQPLAVALAYYPSIGGLVLVDLSTTEVLAPISGEPPVVQHVVTPTVPVPVLVGGRPQ